MKESTVDQLVQRIAGALDFQMSSIQRVDLIRALRTKSLLDNKQRADALPWLPEQVVTELLSELSALEGISAQVHQARTQAAYISGVMRPFDPKYSYRWLSELPESDRQALRVRIENLERSVINSFDELMDWALDVVELFKDVVVADEVSTDLNTKRVSGSIAFKSSRTYIQAWLAFIKRNAYVLLRGDLPDLDQNAVANLSLMREGTRGSRSSDVSTKQNSSFRRSSDVGGDSGGSDSETYDKSEVDDYLDEVVTEMRRLQGENEKLKVSTSPQVKEGPSEPDPSPASRNSELSREGLTISGVSGTGDTSSCYFATSQHLATGLGVWIETLRVLWNNTDDSNAAFEVILKTLTGEFTFSIPNLPFTDAVARLSSLVDRIKNEMRASD